MTPSSSATGRMFIDMQCALRILETEIRGRSNFGDIWILNDDGAASVTDTANYGLAKRRFRVRKSRLKSVAIVIYRRCRLSPNTASKNSAKE